MNRNSNNDLEGWRTLWHAESDEASFVVAMRDRAIRHSRWKRISLLGPIGVTAVIGAWVVGRALRSGSVDAVVLAAEAWLFILAMWAGSLWIDRGTWKPLASTTRAFLDLEIRRCRSALTAARFGVVMYFVQLVGVLGVKAYFADDPATVLVSWPVVLLAGIGGPLLVGLALRYSRRKAFELRKLIQLREGDVSVDRYAWRNALILS